MSIPNPFYDVAKADAHTPQDIADLFVRDASLIWSDIQYPINHIIVGARGSGKTMALRQLDYRTLARRDEKPDFVGIYTHVSRISAIFHTLFTDNGLSPAPRLILQFQHIFADYLVLEIVRNLCNLIDEDNQLARPDFSTVFRFPGGFRSGNVKYECTRLQIEIESSIQSWKISGKCAWQPLGDLSTIIARLALSLRQANAWLARNRPCLYILLDESSPVPVACQNVLNNLLLRGQPFCAKIAVRPFEWNNLDTPSGQPREQNTDVFVLRLDRSDELSDEYVSHMERIVDKILETRKIDVDGIRVALPSSTDYSYSGFDAMCAASSGNPQDLLLICSAIFAANNGHDGANDRKFAPISPSLQHDVICTWSHDFSRQNAFDSSRNLCHALAQKVKKTSEESRSIGFEYRSDDPDLFEHDSLPDDLANPLRPAFAGGFVRSGDNAHVSLFEVPVRFQLSRGVLPDLDVSLETPVTPAMTLNRSFIETTSQTSPRPRVSSTNPEPILHVSSSFIEHSNSRWESLERALLVAGFSFPKIRPTTKRSTWLHSTRRKLASAHVALFGGRCSSFHVMTEIGMCASTDRPVDVIIGQLGDNDIPFQETEGIPRFPIVSPQADDDNYQRFAAEVRAIAEQLMSEPSDFTKVALTGVSLRPKRRREKTVYVSVPKIVSEETLLKELRERLATCGWFMISESDMTSYTANEMQVSLLCAFTARIGVIDTSSDSGLHAIQSYKLGLFAGKRGWRVLHTTNTESPVTKSLDSVPSVENYLWNEPAELMERILRFVAS